MNSAWLINYIGNFIMEILKFNKKLLLKIKSYLESELRNNPSHTYNFNVDKYRIDSVNLAFVNFQLLRF